MDELQAIAARYAKRMSKQIEDQFVEACFGATYTDAAPADMPALNIDDMAAMLEKFKEPMLREIILWKFEQMLQVTRGRDIYFIVPEALESKMWDLYNPVSPRIEKSAFVFGGIPITRDHARALELVSEVSGAAEMRVHCSMSDLFARDILCRKD